MQKKPVTLVLVPWGDPKNWKSVNYKLENLERRSSTTLFVLHDHLKNKYKDIKIVFCLLTVDTLIKYVHFQENSPQYQQIVQKITNEVQKTLKKFSRQYHEENQTATTKAPNLNLHILVLPGIGSSGEKYTFQGDPIDWYSLALIKLHEITVSNNYQIQDVILDSTHGINYTTVFSEQLAYDMSQVALIQNIGQEDYHGLLMMYNCEPFNRDNPSQVLSIHKINQIPIENINFNFIPRQNNKRPVCIAPFLSNHAKKQIGQAFRSLQTFFGLLFEHSNNCYQSYITPLPLLLKSASDIYTTWLVTFSFDFNKIFVETILNNFYKYINCDSSSKTIIRQVSLDEEVLKLELLAFHLNKKIQEFYPLKRSKSCLTLKQLEEMSKNFYRAPYNILAGHEVSRIKQKLRVSDLTQFNFPITLEELFTITRDATFEDTVREVPDARILIAHSGFNKGFVMLDIRNREKIKDLDETIFYYREDKLVNIFSLL